MYYIVLSINFQDFIYLLLARTTAPFLRRFLCRFLCRLLRRLATTTASGHTGSSFASLCLPCRLAPTSFSSARCCKSHFFNTGMYIPAQIFLKKKKYITNARHRRYNHNPLLLLSDFFFLFFPAYPCSNSFVGRKVLWSGGGCG